MNEPNTQPIPTARQVRVVGVKNRSRRWRRFRFLDYRFRSKRQARQAIHLVRSVGPSGSCDSKIIRASVDFGRPNIDSIKNNKRRSRASRALKVIVGDLGRFGSWWVAGCVALAIVGFLAQSAYGFVI